MTDGRHSGGEDRPESGAFPQPGETAGQRGRIRHQDGSTAPREPTLAEKRAREQKLRADREEVLRREARSKTTKRVLIGTGATVGVVALIAAVYAASGGGTETVEARCVDENQVVVPDENCAGTSQNGQVNTGGGFAFVPIFLGGGGRQYHYNYGGTGSVGQVATGGTVNPPPSRGTTVRSGTTGSTISRGGLGVGGSSTSSGGSGTSSGS
ncbi:MULTISPECIES: hypothetical protein [Pseudonocardia]|uniref:Uncharacterized protein n=2 Tax=Pseudonocardia TaxID=1847 RepID=A0A1Y2MIS1_PSEAH|nr:MULTISPECIES: hypothetical protein [Pseudonocardia]OSY35164.1 hypothetical protein BG845_06234 [Pseudonocardia autotrophica]TDN74975.1 hypothetical protein C8E95_4111 [Pseudonocardia autotrophica]BBF98913.1 hypothetical protein Pdca_01230 [Pseudonocardia autotrophica]GEC28635.1 hypothetical protein PSA01_56640 [Pseudonocardia saturnea]